MSKLQVCQEKARIRYVKNVENKFIATRNLAVIYYQTLEEFCWQLELKNSKNDKNFQNLKTMKIRIKILFEIPNQIAVKMVIKSTHALQKSLINYSQPQF